MIYNYNNNGLLVSTGEMEYDPIDNQPMIPAFATTKQPLPSKDGFTVNFIDNEWVYLEIPREKPEKPSEPYYVWDEDLWVWVEDLAAKDSWLLAQAKTEAQAYLKSTDWYFARKAETGKEVPEDVLTKRAEARATLNV